MAQCKIHPLTGDHIAKIATLVDTHIGTLIADQALKNKVADLDPWYELRRVIAQMQESTGAKVEEKKARPPKPPKPQPPQPLMNPPVITGDSGDDKGGA